MKTIRGSWLLAALTFTPSAGAVLFVLLPTSDSVQVCEICGVLGECRERKLPLAGDWRWTTRRERATPLSRALVGLGAVGSHEHRWAWGLRSSPLTFAGT